MAVGKVIVIAGAVEIGRHHTAVVCAVLAVVAFAELDASDLRDCVGLVGGLQGTRKESIFLHGLGNSLGVDATGAEEKEFLDAIAVGRIDDVGLDHEVFVDEFGGVGVVGVDAADFGCGEVDLIGFFLGEEGANGSLIGEIELGMGTRNDIGVALGLELADDGGADHATMACDEDLLLFRVHLEISCCFGLGASASGEPGGLRQRLGPVRGESCGPIQAAPRLTQLHLHSHSPASSAVRGKAPDCRGDPAGKHAQYSTATGTSKPCFLRSADRWASRRSFATISAHIWRTPISGTQPRRALALAGSPRRVSTSAGRK